MEIKKYFVVVEVRFLLFNGKDKYTVDFSYGTQMWHVYKGNEYTNCLYYKKDRYIEFGDISNSQAEEMLYEYLKKNENGSRYKICWIYI